MAQKKAFIVGKNGQDASYLSEYLESLDYAVHGLIRRNSIPENQSCRLKNAVNTYYGDLSDFSSLCSLLKDIQPDEIYGLAAQSHVKISFEIPIYTAQTNFLGNLHLLEAIKLVCPQAKFYQASSSEMFGNSVDADGFQRETTPMHPCSPYGISKLAAFWSTKLYRSYGLHCTNGILFNHESPRRGSNFVTSKIIKRAVEIKQGKEKVLELGNLDSYRDWGHSKDYVRAMHQIINYTPASDFVVSTGETHSIRELCDLVFKKLGMDYRDFVKQNPRYMRPSELNFLRGDSTKIRTVLGWKPTYTFESMIDEMLEHYENILKDR